MSNTKSPKTIRELATALEQTLQLPDMVQRIMKSMNSILMVLSIILETGGKPGWHKEVNRHSELLGETLNEKDEQTLQPLVNFVVSLPMASPKQNLLAPLFMRGGAVTGDGLSSTVQAGLDKLQGFGKGMTAENLEELKKKGPAALMGKAAGLLGKGAKGAEGAEGDAEKIDIDINIPYFQLVDTIKAMDAKSDTESVIQRVQEKADGQKDPKPLMALKGFLSVFLGPPIAIKIGETPVPVRLAVALGKTLLDILRLLSSMPGMDIPLLRQVFSIALASVEFYNGEWKQSLLTGAGIFSQSAMYMGFFSKLFLNIFSLISPNLQDDMIYGAYAVTKSIIVGALLYLFQITATKDVRDKAMKFFNELACVHEKTDKVLEDQGIKGQSANINPSMSYIQRVQSASHDWTLTCSTTFSDFIKTDPFTNNFVLKLMFQMLNMPISMEEMDRKCKDLKVYMDYNKYLSFKDLLVIEGGLTKEKMDEISLAEEPAAPKSNTKAASGTPGASGAAGTAPGASGAAGTDITNKMATIAVKTEDPVAPETEKNPVPKPPGPVIGGSRRIRRSLKPSSSPSRKKRTPLQRRSSRG